MTRGLTAALAGCIGAILALLGIAYGDLTLNAYTIAWVAWFAYFAVVEFLALTNDTPGDSLSEHGWEWAAIRVKGRNWRLRRVVMLFLLIWLALHILTGGYV